MTSRYLRYLQTIAAAALITFAAVPAGHALSETQPAEKPAGAPPVPTPQELQDQTAPVEPDGVAEPANGPASDTPAPEVFYDVTALPAPVRTMRELIMEACRSGDIERLRPLIGTGDQITQISLGGIEGDPIEFLKSISGDGEGQEMLAILLEVMEAGYIHTDPGTDLELYVWPYFFGMPLEKLTPVQRVELFKIVTAGDYEDMLNYGAYIFYRVGITPDGRWAYFVAGD